MQDRRQIADELWAAFKHWQGERKYALRLIVNHLKFVQTEDDSNVAHLVAHHAPRKPPSTAFLGECCVDSSVCETVVAKEKTAFNKEKPSAKGGLTEGM